MRFRTALQRIHRSLGHGKPRPFEKHAPFLVERLEDRCCPSLTLTSAGVAEGLTLSTFATGFPSTDVGFGEIAGPFGIAFPGSGGVLVGDIAGNVRLFPTDTDGQSAPAVPPAQNFGYANAPGLAKADGKIYVAQSSNQAILQLNDNGTFNHSVVVGLPGVPVGLVTDPANGNLFVSSLSGQVMEVDPIAGTPRQVLNLGGAIPDGLAITADGSTLFVDEDGTDQVLGFNTATWGLVFASGPILGGGSDGIALGAGPLAGNLFVNTNFGNLVQVSLATTAQTLLASGGSRGDFVSVDPNNGTLLLTQSDAILRLGPGYFLAPEQPVVASGGVTVDAIEGSPSGSQTVATFGDPGGPDPLSHYQATIQWGDSSSSPGTISFNAGTGLFTVSGNHTYAAEGTFGITVTITDATSTTVTVTSSAQVSDPAVLATGGFALTAAEAAPFAGMTVATFTDPGGTEPASDYSADINWGDGTLTQVGGGSIAFAGGVFTVTGGHTYAEESGLEHPGSQPYQITVTVHHEAAPTATAHSTAAVSDPAVLAVGGIPVGAKECILVTAPLATFTDPAGPEPVGDYSVSINWGDNTSSTGTITFTGGVFTATGSHTYAEEGTFTITTTIHHESAPVTVVTSTATVRDNYGLLVLDPTGEKALMVTGQGNVTVNNCGAVVVNSNDSREAAFLTGHGTVVAAETDLSGGLFIADQARVSGELNDEAATPDPLGLGLPLAPATHFAAVDDSGDAPLTLSPGTYDGGIEITGRGPVTLLPGVYYMNGGGFSVTGQGSVSGSGVLIVNAPSGPSDTLLFAGREVVSLTAPTGLTGAYASYNGITILQGPDSANTVMITGQASLTMTGVLYAPKALLKIDGNGATVVSTDASNLGGEVIVFEAMVSGNGDLTINADPAPGPGGSGGGANVPRANPPAVPWGGGSGTSQLADISNADPIRAEGVWLGGNPAETATLSPGALTWSSFLGHRRAQVVDAYFADLIRFTLREAADGSDATPTILMACALERNIL